MNFLSFFTEEVHVTFYADIAAMVLSLGLIVLCGRGIITDSYEGRMFRKFLLCIFGLAVMDFVQAVVCEFTAVSHVYIVITTVVMCIELIFQAAVIFFWVVYLNYRVFRSRHTLVHNVYIRMIPLYALVVMIFVNMFVGIFFFFDENGVYHETTLYYLYSGIIAFYFFAPIIQVVIHKRRHRDLPFFDIWSLAIPTVLGAIVAMASDYYTVALGLALGMANVYAGIINEKSFQDRQTGFFNSFYMRYLDKDLKNGFFTPKSGMILKLENCGDMEAFAGMFRPLIPKNSVAIRYDMNTILLLAEVSDRSAMQMMTEDVEAGLEELGSTLSDRKVSVTMDTMFRKKNETPEDFYREFLQKVG